MDSLNALKTEARRLFHGNRAEEKLTKPERVQLNELCALLASQVGATPEELRRAYVTWNKRYEIPCTFPTLFKHFSSLVALSQPPLESAYPYKPWKRDDGWEPPSEEQRARVKAQLDRVRRRSA